MKLSLLLLTAANAIHINQMCPDPTVDNGDSPYVVKERIAADAAND